MDVSACNVGAELIGLSDARAPWPRSAQSFGPRSPRAWEAQAELVVAKPGSASVPFNAKCKRQQHVRQRRLSQELHTIMCH